ncbi:MAG TPA: PAS domain-containing protein, partial [Thermopolyspora sp.]
MRGEQSPHRDADAPSAIYVDELPDGLIVTDQAGRVSVVNRAAARLTGVRAAEAVGRYLPDVLPFRDAEGRDWWKWLDPQGGLCTRT